MARSCPSLSHDGFHTCPCLPTNAVSIRRRFRSSQLDVILRKILGRLAAHGSRQCSAASKTQRSAAAPHQTSSQACLYQISKSGTITSSRNFRPTCHRIAIPLKLVHDETPRPRQPPSHLTSPHLTSPHPKPQTQPHSVPVNPQIPSISARKIPMLFSQSHQ